jgi:hypothetical protein
VIIWLFNLVPFILIDAQHISPSQVINTTPQSQNIRRLSLVISQHLSSLIEFIHKNIFFCNIKWTYWENILYATVNLLIWFFHYKCSYFFINLIKLRIYWLLAKFTRLIFWDRGSSICSTLFRFSYANMAICNTYVVSRVSTQENPSLPRRLFGDSGGFPPIVQQIHRVDVPFTLSSSEEAAIGQQR